MQLHLPVFDHCSWQADGLRQFNPGEPSHCKGLANCLWQEQQMRAQHSTSI